MALIDADASLGHPVSVHAMNLAVDKCRASGVAVVSVFNSHHFGAAGCYARIAAERGVIGMVTVVHPRRDAGADVRRRAGDGHQSAGLRGAGRRNPPFQLDMATTTVAAGKVKVYKLNHKPLPAGLGRGRRRPAGDRRRGGVRLRLRAAGGRDHAARRHARGRRPQGLRAGGDGAHPGRHAARAPRSRRSATGRRSRPTRTTSATSSWPSTRAPSAAEGEFEDDLDQVIDVLHGARRADPAQPVLVAGDPEMATRAERLRDGVPIPDDLMVQLREVADERRACRSC